MAQYKYAEFEAAFLDWKAQPEGPKKQRLLNNLVKSQIPLLQKFVGRLLYHTTVHVDKEDVMQAAMIGLLTALKRFDIDRKIRFSTMAWPWVRHEVSEMLQHQTQLYRPRCAGMPYKEYRKGEAIEARKGRSPTADELGVTETKLAKWKAAVFQFVPMNELKDDGSDDSVGIFTKADTMRDPAAPVDEQYLAEELKHRMAEAVKKLTPIERRILIQEDYFLPKPICETIKARALRRLKLFLGND